MGAVLAAIVGGAAMASAAASAMLSTILAFLGTGPIDSLIGSLITLLVYSFLLSVVFAATLGLAWHAVASGYGWRKARAYWAPGAVLGFLLGLGLFAVVAMMIGSSLADAWILGAALASRRAVLGGLTGLFAWRIRRPDRDQILDDASKDTSA